MPELYLRYLSSLKLTLWLFGVFLLSILGYTLTGGVYEWLIAGPLLLFSVNLLAAIITRPVFRKKIPLLSFHLSLLAVVLLVAAGQLTSLKANLEVTVGEEFMGELHDYQAGVFHNWKINKVRFLLQDFSIHYAPGLNRVKTVSNLIWNDENGVVQRGSIGDQHPLILYGYRFYTTSNKGFAPTFVWKPSKGKPQTGSIHLPSYPVHEFNQALEWNLSGVKQKLWTELQFDEVIHDPATSWDFRIPDQHKLVFRIDGSRYELVPGEFIDLPEGRLKYKELGSWMGFIVHSDWTLIWLIAASLSAVINLGWHYYSKYSEKPWTHNNDDK